MEGSREGVRTDMTTQRIDSRPLLLGRYRLTRRIAVGGMAAVWEGVDTTLERPVAVKTLSEPYAADPSFVERFEAEARAAAGLSHPNIVGVFDFGRDDGHEFIVMELVDGETLAERLRRDGALPPEEAARLAATVADALDAAHRGGIVHRDVKPGNILLTRDGEVRVSDFGIATSVDQDTLAHADAMLGTAAYIAPERISGLPATPASDIYSLGVVLYLMLAGRPPFEGDSPVALAMAHANDEPPPIRDVRPEVPELLDRACRKALAKDPAGRPASAAAFAATLRGDVAPEPDQTTEQIDVERTMILADGGARSEPPTAPLAGSTQPTHRRPRRVLVVALIVLALLVGLVAAGMATLGGDLQPPASPGGQPTPSVVSSPVSSPTGEDGSNQGEGNGHGGGNDHGGGKDKGGHGRGGKEKGGG
jgi:serine/threonine-protein kinase